MEYRITRRIRRGCWLKRALVLVGLWFICPMPAWANQPPGPHLLLAEILILPVVMLFTALGGGYAVMRALGVERRRWLPIVAVVSILLSGVQEDLAVMLMVVFGGIGLARGGRMVWWGIQAVHRAHASPLRLITAGLMTCLVAIALTGVSFAFVGWWPSEYGTERDLKRLVAYELEKAKERKGSIGSPQFEAPTREEHLGELTIGDVRLPDLAQQKQPSSRWATGHFFGIEFKLGPGAQSFQVWVWPPRMPFFPYNYLISLPSFYADESGQIRMVRVHRQGQRCPPNAAVYYRVRPEDLKTQD